jgi:putative redox protein
MPTRVTLDWIGDSRFEAADEESNTVVLGGAGAEPPAMRPMHMVLVALAGCGATTLRGILEKQRQSITALRFEVEGDRRSEPPSIFTEIRTRVIVRGHDLDRSRVEQAVHLTEEKYCSVYALLRPSVPIITTVVIENETE